VALDLSIEAPVYAIDTIVIDLFFNVFWWGKFRKHKAAVKLCTMLDVKTILPNLFTLPMELFAKSMCWTFILWRLATKTTPESESILGI